MKFSTKEIRQCAGEILESEPKGIRFSDLCRGIQERGLVTAGLVIQEKSGREVICRANHRQVNLVIEFLREKCCMGFEDNVPAARLRRAG